ncbi:MAG: MFS transporter [Candidatus Dadabacteria bacterium]
MVEEEKVLARRRERWRMIGFFVLSGILTAAWSSRIPAIQHKLQLNNASLGTVLFSIPIGLVSGLVAASWLVASFGARKVTLLSCLTTGVFLILAGLSPGIVGLMISLFLFGASRTIFNLAVNTAALEVQREYEQPIIATFHGTWSLACLVSAGIGTLMIISDVKPIYHFIGIAFVCSAIALLIRDTKDKHTTSGERRPLFVKPDKYLFFLGVIAICAMLCESAMFDWSVNYFDKVIHARKSMITLGYMCFISTMAGGRLLGDRLIGSFGIYRMLVINGMLMAFGFAIVVVFPFVLPAALGFLLIGIGDSILVPTIYLLASRSTKMAPGYSLASVTLIGYSGFLIGPLFIGNISEYFGMKAAFFCLALMSLLVVVFTLVVRRISEREEERQPSTMAAFNP